MPDLWFALCRGRDGDFPLEKRLSRWGWLVVWFAVASGTAPAWATVPDFIATAVKLCDYTPTPLNADGYVLCFRGKIDESYDRETIRGLRPNGVFVVTSTGGLPIPAMEIAEILREKNATVVVRDYCLSACANVLLVATERTYVLRDALVAWHGLTDVPTREAFYQRRGLDGRFGATPQTLFTKKIVGAITQAIANKRSVFWMWHPTNHGAYFKDRIVYEAYPESQEEVDQLIRRQDLGRVRVIYDPPDEYLRLLRPVSVEP